MELERHVVSLSFFPSLPEWTILSVGLSQSRTPSSGSFFSLVLSLAAVTRTCRRYFVVGGGLPSLLHGVQLCA